MSALIEAVLKDGGGLSDLEIKIFGGASMFAASNDVGAANVRFAHQFLAANGLKAESEDTGGTRGRRIHYMPTTGRDRRWFLCAQLPELDLSILSQNDPVQAFSFFPKPPSAKAI